MKKYFSSKSFFAGFVIFFTLLLILLTGTLFSPYDYDQIDVMNKFAPFSKDHLLGTDYLGRDLFTRIAAGLKLSLFTGGTVMLAGLFTGTILGAISGYFGKFFDTVISKITDLQMSFPGMLLALMLVAVFGTGLSITVIALYIMSIPRFTRIARAGFIKYRESLFVQSAKAKGASDIRIIFVHILPNILPDLMVTSTLNFSLSVLSESGLSYLGLGVQPPVPSFGRILNEGQRFIIQSPACVLVPAVFLILLVLSLNLIGEGIAEASKV